MEDQQGTDEFELTKHPTRVQRVSTKDVLTHHAVFHQFTSPPIEGVINAYAPVKVQLKGDQVTITIGQAGVVVAVDLLKGIIEWTEELQDDDQGLSRQVDGWTPLVPKGKDR